MKNYLATTAIYVDEEPIPTLSHLELFGNLSRHLADMG
jgi:hypothetical protein